MKTLKIGILSLMIIFGFSNMSQAGPKKDKKSLYENISVQIDKLFKDVHYMIYEMGGVVYVKFLIHPGGDVEVLEAKASNDIVKTFVIKTLEGFNIETKDNTKEHVFTVKLNFNVYD
ncbi:MAG: hypothetical protein IIA45_13785 [Bacteroidetes bacterium]|nr:hypothetical protein [Bacteroidota bacterium]